jgi:hypothetical protein
MLQDIRIILANDRATLAREALGLLGLWTAILAALFLPVLV